MIPSLLLGLSLFASPPTVFDHSSWDRILKAFVNDIGEVDYGRLKTNRKDLDDYALRLGESSPDNRRDLFPSRAHELAYWLNAYNAFVMKGVVEGYPTRSVRDLGLLYGFFRRKDYVAGGVKMSLLFLENDIIRRKYREPRIHFGLVCASVSCPLLPRDAFSAENLEAQLEQLARGFINQRRSVTIDAGGNEIVLSKIFDWYTEDFVPPDKPKTALVDYVRRYANPENRRILDGLKQPRVRFHDYDWSINEPGSRARAKSNLERELAQPHP